MLSQTFIIQPASMRRYVELLQLGFGSANVTHLDAAAAYATRSGVLALDEACRQHSPRKWPRIRKRWLVGIDYCRTEPLALEMLYALPNSEVRVHAAKQLVARRLCTPVIPFHPKVYVLRGPGTLGVICGSGNLSSNGLTRGHEVGCLTMTVAPANSVEQQVADLCRDVYRWFRSCWRLATPLRDILGAYQRVYETAEHLRAPSPTDEDAADTRTFDTGRPSRRALGPDDLRKLRTCKSLWIEAGNLHHNRGKYEDGRWKPGNQLMLTPMTRVFFGFPARDLPPDTAIGQVRVSYLDRLRPDCSLRFSNNSMDVLTLPVPGDGGPGKYDQENLLFEKASDGSFVLSLGDNEQKRTWIRRSKAIGGYHQMTSGRQWGVF